MAENMTEMAVKLERTHEMCVSNERRIKDLEIDMKSLHDTQISLVKITGAVESMGQSVTDIKTKVDNISEKQDNFAEKLTALENKPAQKTKRVVDDIIEKITWVIIGGLIIWFLAQLFPSIPW